MQLPIDLPPIPVTLLALAFAFLYLLRTRCLPQYRASMFSPQDAADLCVVCGIHASKKCSSCKAVRYCSAKCQVKHWQSGHKSNCHEFKLKVADRKRFPLTSNTFRSSLSLAPSSVICRKRRSPETVLFSYQEFITLYNCKVQAFPPCGLLNCGNSCFANVVLQCLSCTRPLVAFFLESNHASRCRRSDWCFLCELQFHIQRVRQSYNPFSPLNILSRLPNIGGNLECGSQEDAHEFMRFAVETMQSVCLDEFGGEKEIDLSVQETTLINHIFGGQLASQVVCTKCGKISHRHENMMDLTVEIQGDASCLEECLNQFTNVEQLDGDNLYKCDGCNEYVKAWKRLTVNRAPNILTVALKRFQGGRFGKLNKRVTFPETLDLTPYMSDAEEDGNICRLYAVVVHIDMLNASFFGHYICFIKDFSGNWYRVDDCKVTKVELEDVLGHAAYMLMYSREHVRPYMVKRVNMKQNEETLKSSSKDLHVNVSAQSGLALNSENLAQSGLALNSENLAVVSGCEVIDSDQSDEGTQKHGLSSQNAMVDSIDIAQGRDSSILSAAVMNSSLSRKIEKDESLHHFYVSKDATFIQDTSSFLSSCEESDAGASTSTLREKIIAAEPGNTELLENAQTDIPDTDSLSLDCSTSSSSLTENRISISHAQYEDKNSPPETALQLKVSSVLERESSMKLSSVKNRSNAGKNASKPLFCPGFLDKPVRSKSLIDKEKSGALPMDIDVCHQSKQCVGDHLVGQQNQTLSSSSEITEGKCGYGLHVKSKQSFLRPGFLNS